MTRELYSKSFYHESNMKPIHVVLTNCRINLKCIVIVIVTITFECSLLIVFYNGPDYSNMIVPQYIYENDLSFIYSLYFNKFKAAL